MDRLAPLFEPLQSCPSFQITVFFHSRTWFTWLVLQPYSLHLYGGKRCGARCAKRKPNLLWHGIICILLAFTVVGSGHGKHVFTNLETQNLYHKRMVRMKEWQRNGEMKNVVNIECVKKVEETRERVEKRCAQSFFASRLSTCLISMLQRDLA